MCKTRGRFQANDAVAVSTEACCMIQDPAATVKALPEVLELSRGLTGITGEARMRGSAICPILRGFIPVMRQPPMLRYRRKKALALRAILPIFIALFCFTTLGLAAQTSPAGPLPPAAPSDQPAAAVVVAKPRSATLLGDKPNLSGIWNLNKDQSDDPQQLMQQASKSSGNNNNGGRVHGGWGGGGWGGLGGPGGGMGGSQGQGQSRSPSGDQREMTDDLSQITVEQTATSAKIIGPSGDLLGVYQGSDTSNAKPGSTSSGNTATSTASGTAGSSSATSTGTSASNSPGNPVGTSSGGTPASSANGSSGNGGDRTDPHGTPVAKWKGNQLVVVTSGEHGSTTTRTYELSADSQQLDVTTKVDNPRFKHPVTINFVYDPAPSGG